MNDTLTKPEGRTQIEHRAPSASATVADHREPSAGSDLTRLVGVVLVTLILSLGATWLLLLGPRDRAITVMTESGRRTEAAVSRIEQDIGRVRAELALVAATQLRDAVMSGRPYAVPLRALAADLQKIPAATAHLAALQARAADGIPDLRALSDSFGTLATDALTADAVGADAGWMARFAARFGAVAQYASLRMGVDTGLSSSAEALRQIWSRFATSDLGAVNAAGLSPDAAQAMQPWLDAVAARFAATAAADGIVAAAAAAR